jgi:hypothetical protein
VAGHVSSAAEIRAATTPTDATTADTSASAAACPATAAKSSSAATAAGLQILSYPCPNSQ